MGVRFWTLPPFAMVAGAMAYLLSKYEELPARYPVHWGVSGQADGFAEKGLGVVLLPGLLGLGVLALLAFNAWQLEKSARGSARAARWMAGLEYAVALLFLVVVLLPVIGPLGRNGTLALILAPAVVVVAVAIGVSSESRQAARAPRESWKWGVFYYDPSDPDIMVPKRTGLGYTLNFGHRGSWVILGLILASAVLSLAVMKWR